MAGITSMSLLTRTMFTRSEDEGKTPLLDRVLASPKKLKIGLNVFDKCPWCKEFGRKSALRIREYAGKAHLGCRRYPECGFFIPVDN